MEGEETVHKRPFTEKELEKIVALCRKRKDETAVFIVIGLCTGLRRGDICALGWDAFDFRRKIVRVTTHKTLSTVEIPLLPLLTEALGWLPRGGAAVLPEMRAIYEAGNTSGVTLRVQNFLAEVLTGVVPAAPKDRMKCGGGATAARAAICRRDRVGGRYRANIVGCHSLRTTFVTLAVAGGVPSDKIIAITGHKTVARIMRNYFRPSGADLRKDFLAAMPAVLTRPAAGTAQTPADGLAAGRDLEGADNGI